MAAQSFPLHDLLYETAGLYLLEDHTYLACTEETPHILTREQLAQCHPDAPLVFDALLAKGDLDDDKKPCVFGHKMYSAIKFLQSDFIEVEDTTGKIRFMNNLSSIKLSKKKACGLIIAGEEALVEKIKQADKVIPLYLGPVGGPFHTLKIMNGQLDSVSVSSDYLNEHIKDWRLRFKIANDLGVSGDELARYVLLPKQIPDVQMGGITFNND